MTKNFPILTLTSDHSHSYLFPGPTEHVPAMERVKQLVAEAGIEGRAFAISER